MAKKGTDKAAKNKAPGAAESGTNDAAAAASPAAPEQSSAPPASEGAGSASAGTSDPVSGDKDSKAPAPDAGASESVSGDKDSKAPPPAAGATGPVSGDRDSKAPPPDAEASAPSSVGGKKSGQERNVQDKSGKKSKSDPPPEACPIPSGQSPVCDDPEARKPKPKKGLCKKKPKPICDCIQPGAPPSDAAPVYKTPGFPEPYFVGDQGTQTGHQDEMQSELVQKLLMKKREGKELLFDELRWFCREVAEGNILDCQIGAMLMAMAINGITDEETLNFTKALVASGNTLEWKDGQGVPVDKHSTGGVGDKVSIVLAPVLARHGLRVPMLSGRGLAHTGGTLDKLESIPGFIVQCSKEMLEKALEESGFFIAGASQDIVPADRVLYSVRNVTATADLIPLIVASIISKKMAAGSKLLVMDIKVGKAAFFKDLEGARELAQAIIDTSYKLGIKTRAALTKMDVPIGRGIGNALEVEDAIECLKGHGTPDLVELVADLGSLLLLESKNVSSLEEGKSMIYRTLESGEGLEMLRRMLVCQGVSQERAMALCKGHISDVLPVVPSNQITPMRVKTSGTITNMDALMLGKAVWQMGAGRFDLDEIIDYRVGVWLTHVVGDVVKVGDVWAEVHHASEELDHNIREHIENSITIEPGKVEVNTNLLIEII